jgi:DNA-binding NarL/FixJ family response regulator
MEKKILIVEDEVLVGMMLASNISKSGFTVQNVVTTAEEAIASVQADPPDAILMDISLTGAMDGIDAASLIKSRSDIPVIFFTGYQDSKMIDRAEAVGPAAIIDKLGPADEIQKVLVEIFS